MNFLKRIRSSLNRLLSPQPGKNGSSMAFVMIIGAVLVIWVLAIMPLMVAVGNNSLTLQGSYADYLGSRSAIEFCKGELENIVETKPPYTFCVVKNGDTYTAIPKMDSITLSDQYDKAINRDPDATDVNNINDDVDTDDVPKNTAEGNSVVAICAIAQDEKEENVYNIIITTYNNGKKGLTYSTVYTISGSLLINPESYKQTQALPLSDFVLVDGKLGSKIVWNSNIRGLTFSKVTDLSQVVESLLPYDPTKLPGSGYAGSGYTDSGDPDSGEYPAVFKVPVLPADDPTNGTGNTSNEPLTTNDWTLLNPVKENKVPKDNGDVWYKVEQMGYSHYKYNAINVYLRSGSEDIRITDYCKIYLNGVEHTNSIYNPLPTSGIYTVSIDMTGYGKFLPVKGLQMLDLYDKSDTGSDSGSMSSEKISDPNELIDGQKYLLTNNNLYAMYHDGFSLKATNYKININEAQEEKFYWTVEKKNGSFYLKASNGQYLVISNSGISLGNKSVNIDKNGDALSVYRFDQGKNRYLNIQKGSINSKTDKKMIYFYMQTDIIDESQNSTHTFTYGVTKDDIENEISATDLKLNGIPIDYATLNAGTYLLTGKVSGKEISLGKLIIEKAPSLSADTISLSFTVDEDDPQKITVSASGLDGNGGVCYIGYAVKNSGKYHWFPADHNSYTFRLDYGHYDLAVRDSGTRNHGDAIKTLGYHIAEIDSGKTFVNGYQSSMMMGTSLYFMGRDNVTLSNAAPNNYSIDTKGNTIYLTADLLVLRHGIKGSGKVIVKPYTTDDNEQNDTLLFAVNDIKNASGHVVFEALHFYKIPANTDINGMSAEDAAALESKDLGSEDTEEIKQIQYWFRKGLYPVINLDVAYLDRDASGSKDKYYTDSDDRDTYRKPDNRQLSHIVSGETIGWTNNGTLVANGNKSNDNLNKEFVVCPYVQKMSDNAISYSANRILLSAKDQDGNSVLTVPNTLSFTCRYYSLDVAELIQEASVTNRRTIGSFVISDLGQDESFVEWICGEDVLNIFGYSSKTLQMDFEQYTTVYGYSSQGSNVLVAEHLPRINRFETTVDLFEAPETLPLMATYSTTDVASLFSGHWLQPIKHVRAVDRYTTISCKANDCPHTNCKLQFGTWGSSALNIFTNYLYVDANVNQINIYGLDSDIKVSSQERGYKSEYLGYFGNYSPESYGGTIVYFAEKTQIVGIGSILGYEWERYSFPVEKGFYYIPSTDDGISLSKLQSNKLGIPGNNNGTPWKIDPIDLSTYSVYINPDGTLSNAYVDTGIFDNTAEGAGGFSGGNVG